MAISTCIFTLQHVRIRLSSYQPHESRYKCTAGLMPTIPRQTVLSAHGGNFGGQISSCRFASAEGPCSWNRMTEASGLDGGANARILGLQRPPSLLWTGALAPHPCLLCSLGLYTTLSQSLFSPTPYFPTPFPLYLPGSSYSASCKRLPRFPPTPPVNVGVPRSCTVHSSPFTRSSLSDFIPSQGFKCYNTSWLLNSTFSPDLSSDFQIQVSIWCRLL